mmetsp:Transcript_45409/g.119255  ORF Transcript_45409/g.119255 Transcript_45409/m.119255 type:complete len:225 (-) Transcript_45409:942-1616(-)
MGLERVSARHGQGGGSRAVQAADLAQRAARHQEHDLRAAQHHDRHALAAHRRVVVGVGALVPDGHRAAQRLVVPRPRPAAADGERDARLLQERGRRPGGLRLPDARLAGRRPGRVAVRVPRPRSGRRQARVARVAQAPGLPHQGDGQVPRGDGRLGLRVGLRHPGRHAHRQPVPGGARLESHPRRAARAEARPRHGPPADCAQLQRVVPPARLLLGADRGRREP